MTPSEYLDAAKKALNIESDYALSKLWKVSTQRLSDTRSGHLPMINKLAFLVADTIGKPRDAVITDLEAQRAKNSEEAKFWRSLQRKAAALLMPVALGVVTNIVTPSSTEAAPLRDLCQKIMYIM